MLKPSASTLSPATRHRAARGERRGVSTQGPGASGNASGNAPGLDEGKGKVPLGPLASGSSGQAPNASQGWGARQCSRPRGRGAEGRAQLGIPPQRPRRPRTMRPMSPSASVIRQRGQALAHLHTTPEQVTLHFGALTKVPSSRRVSYASLQTSPLQASEHTSLPQLVQVLSSCRCRRYAIGTRQPRSPRSPARILKLLRLST